MEEQRAAILADLARSPRRDGVWCRAPASNSNLALEFKKPTDTVVHSTAKHAVFWKANTRACLMAWAPPHGYGSWWLPLLELLPWLSGCARARVGWLVWSGNEMNLLMSCIALHSAPNVTPRSSP
jgi:hypothetical protein